MKTVIRSLLFVSAVALASCQMDSQSPYVRQVEQQRASKDSLFKASNESPLELKQKRNLQALAYFDVDSNYRVPAKLERYAVPQPIKMEVSSGAEEDYFKIGKVVFSLKGKSCSLVVYQNAKFMNDPQLKNTLFLPFNDLTNGKETYHGGRFMDIDYEGKDDLILDFNNAYNPYCAYSDNYTCPVPPEENRLPFRVEAGEKKFAGSQVPIM
jgi:hypothetical protein